MWLASKIKQVLMVMKPGVVTLKYPFEPRPAPENFRGAPHWDHTKCIGCGGCADHCPARTIMVRDLCQEIRVLLYDGSRCTYCGRCADVCPEKAIAMTPRLRAGDRRPERHHREPGALHADLPALRPLLRHGDDERDRQARA
ncbi:MAG: 4Fe-4S binding protein [Marinilabiliales bacterium]|nr:4Fe-4S binding protein [Marinilabiliales bacterium]